MAEVLSKGSLFSPGRDRFGGVPGRKGGAFCAWLHRCSSLEIAGGRGGFSGERLSLRTRREKPTSPNLVSSPVQTTLSVRKALKWWEKGLQPNMKEIDSAQDLVDSLLSAGDELVVVDFFSPGCGGCRALHPKICQFSENNPDVIFLQVNYEKHKSMCYSLNVHVLPFFRFYRGAQGRLCSFSCTIETIKKFKNALAKHRPERCSLGPSRGLEESELLALAGNKDLSFSYTRKPVLVPDPDDGAERAVPVSPRLASGAAQGSSVEEKMALVSYGR